MENETVSRNFIEQIIDKDLEEGHCKTVPAGAKRLPSYRTCEVHPFKLRTGAGIRRKI